MNHDTIDHLFKAGSISILFNSCKIYFIIFKYLLLFRDMAGLFLLMSVGIGAIFLGRKVLSLWFILFSLGLGALILCYHMTDALRINL